MKFAALSLIVSIMLCCLLSRSHAQYLGGDGDGYALLTSANLSLDGENPDVPYLGGDGDGYAKVYSSNLPL